MEHTAFERVRFLVDNFSLQTCLRSIGYDHYFPNNKIHSAESDFKPSRFKPHPDVYLKGFSFLTVLQK